MYRTWVARESDPDHLVKSQVHHRNACDPCRVSRSNRTSSSGVSGQRAHQLRKRDMVGDEGFEPSQAVSETAVLPLHQSPVSGPRGPRRHHHLFDFHARLDSGPRWGRVESNHACWVARDLQSPWCTGTSTPERKRPPGFLRAALDLVRLRAVSPRFEGLLRASGCGTARSRRRTIPDRASRRSGREWSRSTSTS